jgi:hypothetical protein
LATIFSSELRLFPAGTLVAPWTSKDRECLLATTGGSDAGLFKEESTMNCRWTRVAQLSAIGTCCSLAVWISTTSAKDEQSSLLVKKPAVTATEGPTLPPPAKPAQVISAPQKSPQQQTVQKPAGPTAKRPFIQAAQPRDSSQGKPTLVEPMPPPSGNSIAPPAKQTNVHPAPPIDYETHHKARRMYHSGQVQMVMVTQDPADGCCYEIPLCVPACCTDAPKVSAGRGIFGRGVVEYCWSCGFVAKVKFRHVLGDVKVDYEVD